MHAHYIGQDVEGVDWIHEWAEQGLQQLCALLEKHARFAQYLNQPQPRQQSQQGLNNDSGVSRVPC